MIDRDWSDERLRDYVLGLPVWARTPALRNLVGGLCNRSWVADDGTGRYVVRVGHDIPVHGILQTSVGAALAAASELGVTPRLVHAEPSLAVIDFIDGRVLRNEDMADPSLQPKIVAAYRTLHGGGDAVRGTLTYFWPFQVVRNYARLGTERRFRLMDEMPEAARIATLLERQVEPFVPVLSHNDPVPQNLMLGRDGRVWLIDWDYGGYGHPLFDLAALCANSDASPEVEARLMDLYFGRVTDRIRRQFTIFRLIVNLREYLWGMAQELTSRLHGEAVKAAMAALYPDQEQGYEGYTNLNRERFFALWTEWREELDR
jgi:thiamine kinase-like enzyme